MWNVKGVPENANWLTFEPIRILDEFDIPCAFVCKDTPGNTYLAYLCGQDRQGVRYLVVPCSDDLERELVTGKINLRDALTKNRAWIFDLNTHWDPVRAWRISVDDLPANILPNPGVMLYAHLPRVVNAMTARPWANDVEIYTPQRQGQWVHAEGVVYA
jgi:hypothetical protein